MDIIENEALSNRDRCRSITNKLAKEANINLGDSTVNVRNGLAFGVDRSV